MNIWIAVDKDGVEVIYDTKPYREQKLKMWESNGNCFEVPKGTFKTVHGEELDWECEPKMISIDLIPCGLIKG